ncbi:MAG: alpha/beta hydrolase, partial [Alphaproteobacteria bacterium]
PISDWDVFVGPIVDVAGALDLAGAIVVGHSMGGHLAARLAMELPAAVSGLVLVDPVMPPPQAYTPGAFGDLPGPEAHPVARRRDRWPDWRAFFERFRDREPYSLWRPEILEAYCRHGLRPAPDGDGHVLACAPILEASVYFNSWRANILDRLKTVAAPVTILRARYVSRDPNLPVDFARSTTWAGLADHFADAIDVDMAPLTHFIPMQDPEAVARHVVALSARAGMAA